MAGSLIGMSEATARSFYVAPFVFNGELQGVDTWQISELSPCWLEFGREVLRDGGPSFSASLPAPFQRASLRFTSACGTALATFSFDGVIVASSAYLRGDDPIAEKQLLEMFIESLRRVPVVRQSQISPHPFAEVFSITKRPLHVVVTWGSSPAEDSEMVTQLDLHFAGGFLDGRNAG